MHTIARADMKNWHVGFEKDVKWMSRSVFIRKHGIYYANFFDEYHAEATKCKHCGEIQPTE
jgi:hypothetical protein